MSVGLHSASWIAGTCSSAYFGPVIVLVADWDYERGMNLMLDELERQTEARGGNNVVGMLIEIDPFAEPPLYRAEGTAAKLEKAW